MTALFLFSALLCTDQDNLPTRRPIKSEFELLASIKSANIARLKKHLVGSARLQVAWAQPIEEKLNLTKHRFSSAQAKWIEVQVVHSGTITPSTKSADAGRMLSGFAADTRVEGSEDSGGRGTWHINDHGKEILARLLSGGSSLWMCQIKSRRGSPIVLKRLITESMDLEFEAKWFNLND